MILLDMVNLPSKCFMFQFLNKEPSLVDTTLEN